MSLKLAEIKIFTIFHYHFRMFHLLFDAEYIYELYMLASCSCDSCQLCQLFDGLASRHLGLVVNS